jgi:hypothetical protein
MPIAFPRLPSLMITSGLLIGGLEQSVPAADHHPPRWGRVVVLLPAHAGCDRRPCPSCGCCTPLRPAEPPLQVLLRQALWFAFFSALWLQINRALNLPLALLLAAISSCWNGSSACWALPRATPEPAPAPLVEARRRKPPTLVLEFGEA